MVNIKNKIIKTKINSFLERNELVLFYHYSNLNTKHWNILKAEIYKVTPVEIMMAKNKIVQKAIVGTENSISHADSLSFCTKDSIKKLSPSVHHNLSPPTTSGGLVEGQHYVPSFSCEESCLAPDHPREMTFIEGAPRTSQLKNTEKVKSQIKTLFTENCDLQTESKKYKLCGSKVVKKNSFFSKCYSLLQGPTLLIGCKSIKQMFYFTQLLNKRNNFLLLGGFYQKQVINHIDVHRLVHLEHQIYEKLLQKMQNPLHPIILLKKQFHFYFLHYYQQKLICILKNKVTK